MASGTGRAKIQAAYTRALQRNTWAAMVGIKPELAGTNPDFSTMSPKKVWAYIDGIEQSNGMDRVAIEAKTKAI